MAATTGGPIVPVFFDESAIAEDLSHQPSTARKALDLLHREVDRDGGLPFSRLKRCEAEGRDGTRLSGCVKTYVPWPVGRFGLVLLPVAHPTRSLALRAFAYGVRHPSANKPSVYEVADQRRSTERA